MKTKIALITIILSVILTSCSSSFYQVYKVVPDSEISVNDNLLVFEDENCRVLYNLWGEKGNIGFDIYNKSDHDLYLDLEECFFIRNGVANDYFRDRIFTSEGASEISIWSGYFGIASSTTNKTSVSIKEPKSLCVPPNTMKHVSEYSVNESIYLNCTLPLFPTNKNLKSLKFSKEDSPLVFTNKLSYYILDNNIPTVEVRNEFFVSEITNYPSNEFIEYKYPEYCGKKGVSKKMFFKDVAPDKFFLKYSNSSTAFMYGN